MVFVIPLSPSDLLDVPSGQLGVENAREVSRGTAAAEVDCLLDELSTALSSNPCALVADQDAFDICYSLTIHVSLLHLRARKRLFALLSSLVAALTSEAQSLASQLVGSTDASLEEEKELHCSAVTVAVYFYSLVIDDLHVALVKAATQQKNRRTGARAASSRAGRKATKPSKSKRKQRGKGADSSDESGDNDAGDGDDNGDDDLLPLETDAEQVAVLQSLATLLAVPDIIRLWPVPRLDDEFLKLFSSVAASFMQNAKSVRTKPVRYALWGMVGVVASQHARSALITTRLVPLMKKYDFLSSHVAECVERLATEYQSPTAVRDILADIASLTAADLTYDTTGTRNLAGWLPEIAQRCPTLMLANSSYLVSLLECEVYSIRSAVVQALGILVMYAMHNEHNKQVQQAAVQASSEADGGECNDEGEAIVDETAQQEAAAMSVTTDALLTILRERFRDVNAFTRARTIGAWISLVQAKAVPLRFLSSLQSLAISRLEDRSALVRKGALQLLCALLRFNPFSAKLQVDAFRAELARVELKLGYRLRPEDKVLLRGGDDEQEQQEGSPSSPAPSDGPAGGDDSQAESAPTDAPSLTLAPEELSSLRASRKFLRSAIRFTWKMEDALPIALALMNSTIISDVLESLAFFTAATEFRIEAAWKGIAKGADLVFRSQEQIVTAVVDTFAALLTEQWEVATAPPKVRDYFIARTIVQLALSSSKYASHDSAAEGPVEGDDDDDDDDDDDKVEEDNDHNGTDEV